MRLRSICRALLSLDGAWCVLGLALPDLPAWKMFDSSDGEPFTMVDGEGRAIDARSWLPRGASEVDARDAVRIGRWLCDGRRVEGPVTIDARAFHRVVVCEPR